MEREPDSPTTIHRAEGIVLVVVAAGAAVGANQTDHVAPILTFAGALIVAAMTWISTDRRQTRQLAHESKRFIDQLAAEDRRQTNQLTQERARLTAELAAERDRQARALAHNRELADLDDLRELLNGAAILLHEAGYAAAEARSKLTLYAQGVTGGAPDPTGDVFRCGRELDAMAGRLSVRLGDDDRLSRTFKAAYLWLLTFVRQLGQTEFNRAEMGKRLTEAIDGFESNRNYFRLVAAARVGASMSDCMDPLEPGGLQPPPPDAMPHLMPQPVPILRRHPSLP